MTDSAGAPARRRRHLSLYLVSILLLVLLMAPFLTGCGGSFLPQQSENTESGGTGAPAVHLPPGESAESGSEDVPDSGTEDSGTRPQSILGADFPKREGITDLTAAARKAPGDLCAYALADETHVLLLSIDGRVFKTTLLDVPRGTLTPQAEFACARDFPGDDADISVEILSVDPLVVRDEVSGYLYQPQAMEAAARQILIPEWLSDASFSVLDGQVYFSTDRGIVFKIEEDGSYSSVWTLPLEYSRLTPVPLGKEGKLSFMTYPEWNESLIAYLDLDPVTGEADFYRSNASGSYYSAAADGILISTYYRQAPCITLRDTREGTQKVLSLPDTLYNAKDPAILACAPVSLCGDKCCWMISDDMGRPLELYLWDSGTAPAEDWELPWEEALDPPEEIVYGNLTQRARDLEDRYGVRIVMGQNVPVYFNDYEVTQTADEELMDGTLSVIENTLSLFPEDFFRNVKGSYYREIVIYLTGEMVPSDSDSNISNAGAFTTEDFGVCRIALDLWDDPALSTVLHELFHVVDYMLTGESLLDEEAWNAMNPPGFSYYYAYIDENGESYENTGSADYTIAGGGDPDEIWFIDAYSKTFPMEDRARLMEYLLGRDDPPNDCFRGRHIQEKLGYYFTVLRQTLGDDSWPEQTVWEEVLHKMRP